MSPTATATDSKRRRTGTVLAVVFGTVVVAGTAAALSRFVGFGQRSKAYECKVVLRDLLWSQRDFRAGHSGYARTFAELRFKPDRSLRYTYFLSESEVLGPDTAGISAAQLPPLSPPLGASAGGFVAACAANLDDDPALDVWTISAADGEPVHVASDQ